MGQYAGLGRLVPWRRHPQTSEATAVPYGLHLAALLLYGTLSILLSWPTLLHFTSSVTTSDVDAWHNLWRLWHVEQVLLGRAPPFDAPLLYYPQGISLLVHGVGPLTGLFALPFWPLGPAAAYNGALLVALTLSGYCTFVLARGLELDADVALFAGVLVLSSPMVLAGLNNHLSKVFVGGPALTLLALHHALDLRRSRWWAAGLGAGLLLTLLHNGYQFVFAALALAALTLLTLRAAPRAARGALLGRAALAALAALLISGPLLAAIVQAGGNPAIGVDVNAESRSRPDLAQLLLPWHGSLLFGGAIRDIAAPFAEDRTILLNSEMAVSLAAVGVLLCLVAWWRGEPRARHWCLLALAAVVLALGPSLQVLGRTTFTEYELPVMLPYALLTGLPGLEFMRAPGRFMMLGFTLFAIAAAFGLAWLVRRFPRRRRLLVGGAGALALLQVWPAPFPSAAVPQPPAFYRELAADPAEYGVFDLPIKSSEGLGFTWKAVWTSSYYQVFQMTHGKGIASGYISRTYVEHPLFDDLMAGEGSILRIDGEPALYRSFRADLQRLGYRYAVLHKRLFATPDGAESPGTADGRALLAATFAGERPVRDDAEVLVYEVTPAMAGVSLRWGSGWRDPEEGFRWATSRATLEVSLPERVDAQLVIVPALLHDPDSPGGLGATGVLRIADGGREERVALTADQPASVPLSLEPGDHTLTLTLEAGSFRPADYGQDDDRELSFAVRSIDLVAR